MKNIKLTVQYDGSKFYGWQKLNDLPSVQLEIEKAVEKMIHQPVKINGAGRTDKGVHAKVKYVTSLLTQIFQQTNF